MSASSERPERLAEILREIIALSKTPPGGDSQCLHKQLDRQSVDPKIGPIAKQDLPDDNAQLGD
jgi:hypothetical protein